MDEARERALGTEDGKSCHAGNGEAQQVRPKGVRREGFPDAKGDCDKKQRRRDPDSYGCKASGQEGAAVQAAEGEESQGVAVPAVRDVDGVEGSEKHRQVEQRGTNREQSAGGSADQVTDGGAGGGQFEAEDGSGGSE